MPNIVPEGAIPAKNGGWLTPGNPKATGRPKDKIRALAAEAGSKAVAIIAKKLDEEADTLSTSDIRSCADVLLKYGIGTENKVEQVVKDEELLSDTFEFIRERFGDEAAQAYKEFLSERHS